MEKYIVAIVYAGKIDNLQNGNYDQVPVRGGNLEMMIHQGYAIVSAAGGPNNSIVLVLAK